MGDEIIITALDHYSNVLSWQHIAADKGVTVYQIRVDEKTFELDYDDLKAKINLNTKMVAFTCTSNTTGSVVDAVHYAPHFCIDVQALDCDFLVISGYKFTGPHIAAIYVKKPLFDSLKPYKVEPAPATAPANLEQGTQNFEELASLTAAIEYLASVSGKDDGDLRSRLETAFGAISQYEKNYHSISYKEHKILMV